MYSQPVSCSSVIAQTTRPFVSFHQQLGCFHSDWHQHKWGQFIYAEKGCIHINSPEKHILIPGWYGVWIPANTDHQIWSNHSQLSIRSVCFPVTDNIASLHQSIVVFPVSRLLREMIHYTEKWSHGPNNDAQALTFLQAFQDLLPEAIEKSIVTQLPSTNHQKLLPVITYIHTHLAQPISFKWLASEFGFSVRTLSRLFTQQLGTSFSSYCKIARIMRALELIEIGCDNVSQLAAAVGYESLATFSNNFLEICGHRPLQFIRSKRTKWLTR
jgi:AraC-like DNA-binding protein